MSQQKKQKVNITKQALLWRLKRLPITHQVTIAEFIAFIGLILVNHGRAIDFTTALRIIHKSKLHLKIKANSAIPCHNILDALIHLVVFKRKLCNEFFENTEYEIWQDEIIAPIFDIMYDISKIYKV